ncbi:MAG: hypothetical protein MUC96_00950 [Myxococcaceae bacterium]|jgi:hypothetical protein|nr:hypothetical protein [Myxococcaceae bacterium]
MRRTLLVTMVLWGTLSHAQDDRPFVAELPRARALILANDFVETSADIHDPDLGIGQRRVTVRFVDPLPPALQRMNVFEILALAPLAREEAERAQALNDRALGLLGGSLGVLAGGGAATYALGALAPGTPSTLGIIGIFTPLFLGLVVSTGLAVAATAISEETSKLLDIAVFNYNRDPRVRRW